MKQNNIFVLGVTGGVGSGKTTVLSILEEKGFFVIRADDVAKKLEEKGRDGYNLLLKEFGEEIIDEKGNILPAVLSKIIFSDKKALKKVNNIVHPLVKNEILAMINRETMVGREFFAVEAALFLEANYDSFSDKILFVRTDDEKRRERLSASRNYTFEKTNSIMDAQKPEAFYREKSDYILD